MLFGSPRRPAEAPPVAGGGGVQQGRDECGEQQRSGRHRRSAAAGGRAGVLSGHECLEERTTPRSPCRGTCSALCPAAGELWMPGEAGGTGWGASRLVGDRPLPTARGSTAARHEPARWARRRVGGGLRRVGTPTSVGRRGLSQTPTKPQTPQNAPPPVTRRATRVLTRARVHAQLSVPHLEDAVQGPLREVARRRHVHASLGIQAGFAASHLPVCG